MIKSLIKSVFGNKKSERKTQIKSTYRVSSSGSINDDFEQRKKDLIQHFGKDTIKILGTGNYGIVYLLIRDTPSGQHKYVVKEIELSSENREQTVTREIQILDRLHKNCDPWFLCLESWKIKTENGTRYVLLVFDYIENTEELRKYSKKNPISNDELKKIIKSLVLGLFALHSMGVVHRDIKGGNILIEKYTLNTRYIDFGLACEEKDEDCIRKRVGTPSFLAPDLMTTNQYTWEQLKAGDVWALGVTILDSIARGDVAWLFSVIGNEPKKIRLKVG